MHIMLWCFFRGFEGEEVYTEKIVFSDEATLHLSGNISRYNLRIWGSNNPHEVTEHTGKYRVESDLCFVKKKYESSFFV